MRKININAVDGMYIARLLAFGFLSLISALILLSASSQAAETAGSAPRIIVAQATAPMADENAVACRLPSQIRKLGRSITFLAPPRITRLEAGICAVRGGRPISS